MTDKSNQIDQYLSIAKTLNDAESAVELIQKVIESPSVHSFSDFLELAFFQTLKNDPTYSKYYHLLELFAYGTYSDYKTKQHQYPELNTASITKLRHLSIISIAGKNRTISYKYLCEQLHIGNVRELEDLIIEAFYANIIRGKLDQMKNQLEVEFAIGRDVTDEQVDDILSVLDSWCKNCDIALKTIEVQISQANSFKQKQIDKKANIDLEVLNLKKSIMIQNQDSDSLNNVPKESKKSLKTKGPRVSSGGKVSSSGAK
ncbi:COP9 signalosome complex subunit 7b-like [Brachionus plicatilis]|uniref:COP9 signalosome complex subunit 7b-like n=1 Tax=Brachionus plicatilis TaxID=10195 RepID=A0A3M7QZG0_BRAPC|nr:COP9 signalosome complex subunit 7b-like [Brachionus plicatilis]